MAGLEKSQWWWGHFFTRKGWQMWASWENLENPAIIHDAGEANWPDSMAEVRAQNKDNAGYPWTAPAPGIRFRHNGNDTMNVLFCDGRTEWVPPRLPFSLTLTQGVVLLNPLPR